MGLIFAGGALAAAGGAVAGHEWHPRLALGDMISRGEEAAASLRRQSQPRVRVAERVRSAVARYYG